MRAPSFSFRSHVQGLEELEGREHAVMDQQRRRSVPRAQVEPKGPEGCAAQAGNHVSHRPKGRQQHRRECVKQQHFDPRLLFVLLRTLLTQSQ